MMKIRILIASIIMAFMVSEFFIFGGNGVGTTILFLSVLPVYYLTCGFPKGKFIHKLEHFSLLAFIILLSVPFFIFDNWTVKLVLQVVLIILVPIFFLHGALWDKISWKNSLFYGEVFIGWFARPFACIGSGFSKLFEKTKKAPVVSPVVPVSTVPVVPVMSAAPTVISSSSPKKSNVFLQVILGCIIVFPILAVLTTLLVMADPLFAEFVGTIFERFFSIDIWRWLGHGIVAVILFPFVLSFVWSYGKPWMVFSGEAELLKKRTKKTVMPDVVAMVILSGINILYFFYAAVQLVYLLGAWSGQLPGNLTHAEYARTGFFELAFLSSINVLMIAVCVRFTGRKGTAGIVIRILSLMMILLSAVQLVSAFSRMFLYIQEFGLTRMRLFVTGFMFLMAIFFLFLFIRELAAKFPILQSLFLSSLLFLVVFSYAAPDAIIARFNIYQYQEGMIQELDTRYLMYELSADSKLVVLEKEEELLSYDSSLSDEFEQFHETLQREKNWAYREDNWKDLNVSKILLENKD